MALNDIIDKIKDDSLAEAEEIVAEARGVAEEKVAEVRRRAGEVSKARLEEAERRAETVRVRTLALARLAARDALLGDRQAAAELVFAKAAERLENLDAAAYAKLLERLLVERASDGEEVLPATADAKIVDAVFVERVNRELAGRAGKVSVRLGGPTGEIARGFILKSGRILTNCSLESLVSDAREQLETEVYERLFGTGNKRAGAGHRRKAREEKR